jgi:uncharacterized membrane protein/thiol-disulfide isomerase/thioredoxin
MRYQNNLEAIIKSLGLNITEKALKNTFKFHPDYPSLSTLSDVLSEWKVNSLAVKISPQQLQEIIYPAIAHIEDGGEGYFVSLQKFESQQVTYWDSEKGNITETLELFTSKWKGVVLLLEQSEKSGELDYQKAVRKETFASIEKWIGFITLGFVGLSGFVIADSWQNGLLWFVVCIGTAISTILLLGEYGIKSPTIEKLCNLNNQTNCDTVLASSGSKLFQHFSWAEIGFCYFTGTCIFTIIVLLTKEYSSLNILTIISIIALPYTVFSVYYQWQIVKKWCTLCLVIQTILVLEFIVLFMSNSIEIPTFSSVYLLIISLLIPTSIWFFVKPSLEKASTLPNLERSVMTYKYNNALFMSHLGNQRTVSVDHSPIKLGSEDAPVLITMVSNPYCGPCANAHEALENLMTGYTDYLKVEFIFTGGGQSPEVIKHICSLDKSQIHNALNDWYKMVNFEQWVKKYSTKITEETENQFNRFAEWSNQAQITHTPTFFINGKELVSPYTIQDLKYHVKELAEKIEV